MENPFTSRYTHGNILIKTNAANLFWVLSLMVFAGLAILALSLFGPGITGLAFLPSM